MKLDKNCIRDILMYVEGNSVYKEDKGLRHSHLHIVSFDELCKDDYIKEKYQPDIVNYTIEKMEEHGLIKTGDSSYTSTEFNDFKNYHINSITPKGYSFLDNAKNEIIWSNVNKTIKESGLEDCSLNILFECVYNETQKLVVK